MIHQEDMYRKIFDAALDMIFVGEVETGIILDCNKAATETLGWQRHELIGRHQSSLHPPSELNGEFSRTFRIHINHGEKEILRSQVLTRSGEVRDVSIKASRFELDGKQMVAGIFRDITDTVRREREMANLARFPEENPHPVLRVSRQGAIIYANQASRPFLDHYNLRLRDPLPVPLLDALARAWERKGIETIEVALEEQVFQFSIAPIKDEEYCNLYGLDITRRKKSEEALARSEERYALAQMAARMGSWDWDIRTDTLHWSRLIEPIFGLAENSFGGTYREFLKLVHPDDRGFLSNAVKNALEEEVPYNLEHRIIRPDGEVRWLRETGAVFRDSAGVALRMTGIVQDITEEKKAREQILTLSRAVEQSPVSVVITDLAGNIIYVNPKFTQVSGYSREEVLGRNPRILKSDKHSPEFYTEMWHTLASGREWRGEICDRGKDGREYWESVSISPVADEKGHPLFYVGVKEEITEKKEQAERIRFLALHDPLTGLYNRIAFRDHLDLLLRNAKRKSFRFALIYLDLDGFKAINDRFGHAVGDKLLQSVAARLSSSLRDMDVVARLGGDEFAILINEYAHREEIDHLAGRLLDTVREPLLIDGHSCAIGMSIGISLYPEQGHDPDSLIQCADRAMYTVKKSGRNSYLYCGP